VRKKQVIPARRIYGGVPAVEIGTVTERHAEMLAFGQKAYADLAAQYAATYREIQL
jgi:carbonic anhydrase/acetyltransferase-like protein (isoleucine patch superfamily)